DGLRIAYLETPRFDAGKLVILDAESGRRLKTIDDLTVFGKLHFDVRGERILAVMQPANEKPRLAWCELATGRVTAALPDGVAWPGYPAGSSGLIRQRYSLSPDGTSLAVNVPADVPDEQGGNQGPHNELWQVPLAGGESKMITRWPARVHDICWSADGRSLIVATERGGVHNDLWQVPLDDPEREARQLTHGLADEDSPSISADGRWLVYSDNRHGPTLIVARDLADQRDAIVAPEQLDYGGVTGKVALRIQVRPKGAVPTARITLRHSDGKCHAPPGSLYRLQGNDLHFYAHDHSHMELPAGQYTLIASRGPEYRVTRQTFAVAPGVETEVVASLEPWTDQRAAGWVSGENHIHANYGYGHWYNRPADMRLQCQGEDLTVANFMVANSDGDGVYDREFFLGRPDPLSNSRNVLYWNEEFRSTIWGHLTLLNLKRLVIPIFTGFRDTTHPHDAPTNADIADHVHDQDGHVNYTHPAHSLQDPYATAYSAKELPLDVALGKVDSLDVMGSNHQATLPLWYRLLNCGVRLPASAGTDCFLNRISSRLPGSDRVYVRCEGEFDYAKWVKNLRAGRTFVTNGPMLRFAVDGYESGDVLKLDASGKAQVRGEASSQYPLSALEVVVNGAVVMTLKPEQPTTRIELDREIPLERSGWIALRARGDRASEEPRVDLFAHTSPVYVEVAGRPARSPDDARYFVRWIERLWEDVRKRNRIPARHQPQVEAQVVKALEFYRRLTETHE
ncbi:MAG TPA: CehA/McbA family metallohydrolase, partial [Pirellulaceae bacterium]|nr:CehA/McbA family metallohydrolase [Pirellulaceae bacterium]